MQSNYLKIINKSILFHKSKKKLIKKYINVKIYTIVLTQSYHNISNN